MSRLPLVISYYTKDTPYESEVQRLLTSCRRFAIEAQIEPRPSLGSWEKNAAYKSIFILEKLKALRRPLFWVDADAAFLKAPDFEAFSQCDISVRINEFLPKTHESYMQSGSIFINYTEATTHVIEEWAQDCEKLLANKERCMEIWDQVALRDTLLRHPEVPVMQMPLRFTKIFDFDDFFISDEEVVIEHYQASRRFKHHIHENCCDHKCH